MDGVTTKICFFELSATQRMCFQCSCVLERFADILLEYTDLRLEFLRQNILLLGSVRSTLVQKSSEHSHTEPSHHSEPTHHSEPSHPSESSHRSGQEVADPELLRQQEDRFAEHEFVEQEIDRRVEEESVDPEFVDTYPNEQYEYLDPVEQLEPSNPFLEEDLGVPLDQTQYSEETQQKSAMASAIEGYVDDSASPEYVAETTPFDETLDHYYDQNDQSDSDGPFG
jgi:hypothetical protein